MKPRLLVLLCGLIGLGLAGGIAGPDQMMKGLEFTRVSSQHGYNTLSAQQSLSELAATGANWVTIVPVWWMSDTGASNVYRMDEQSPSDEEVRAVIRRAKDVQGLKVFLRPEVHCVSGVWQGLHDPHDKDWFYSYTSFILRFAAIAQKEGCELFSVGSELDRTADEPWERAHWDELINWVKGTYLGPVTYAADWRTFDAIPFWDSLDYVGINAYFPVWETEFLPSSIDTTGLLATTWRNDWVPAIEDLLGKLKDTEKQVIFTEVGYRSIAGCAHQPWNEELSTTFDAREQRYCYIAAFNAFLGRDWFAGWFFHEWPTDPNQGGQYDVGYSPKGKIAGEVLRRWYAAIGSQRGATQTWKGTRYDLYMRDSANMAQESLKASGAEWIAFIPQGYIDSVNFCTTINVYDTKETWNASPSDLSLYTAIGWARDRDLKVMLKPHIDTEKEGEFRVEHNPQDAGGIRAGWFESYKTFLLRYAAIAESTRCELMCLGCELDGTVDEQADIGYWRGLVIPAIRQAYSGPIHYTSLGLDGGVSLDLWTDLDFIGVDAYLDVYPLSGYAGRSHPDDTSPGQRPDTADIRWNQERGLDRRWLPRLDTLHARTAKPTLFPEIGYQSIDSAAHWGAEPRRYAWEQQVSNTSADLYSVCFPVDTLTGYAVGDSGTIIHTHNSGGFWAALPSGTTAALFSVDHPTRDIGYAVGADGTILRTDSGWHNFQNVAVDGQHVTYRCVRFPQGASVGYVVGDAGVGLKTTSGGASWVPMATGTTADLYGISFPRPDTGFIVGSAGTVLRTTNAGANWTALDIGLDADLRSVHFELVNPVAAPAYLRGHAVGDAGIWLRTHDGGATWQCESLLDRAEPAFHCVAGPAVRAHGDTSVYIAGTDWNVLRTDPAWQLNGGFQHVAAGNHRGLRGVCFPDSLVGFAVGESGTIMRTRGGGRLRIDFNEQKNCTEAVFRAFWRDSAALDPVPWFYGFHWWSYDHQPCPHQTEHETWLDNMSFQQKPAWDVVKGWFAARPLFSPTGHYVRHYPTGSLDVVMPDDGRSNLPLVQLGLASGSWETDPTGSTPADSARLIQEYLGTGDTVVAIDSTGWFAFKTDTVWQYRFGPGKYRFYVQYKDNPDKQSPRYTDFDHQTISYEAD